MHTCTVGRYIVNGDNEVLEVLDVCTSDLEQVAVVPMLTDFYIIFFGSCHWDLPHPIIIT